MSRDSYWARILHRLRAQRPAQFGAVIIISLLLFCFVGPLVWRLDPAAIDPNQISMAPHWGISSVRLDGLTDVSALPKQPLLSELTAIAPVTTQQVILSFALQDGETVSLYRHLLEPSGPQDFGLPLAVLHAESAGNHYYSDQLLLEPRRYYYSVVRESDHETLAVDVVHGSVVHSSALPEVNDHQWRLPAHPFGTDKLGRDVMARVMAGGQISLLIALSAPFVFICIGALYGAIAGFYGSTVDAALMAVADFVIALPFLLFVILLRVAFGFEAGSSGMLAIIAALVLLSWPEAARVVRAQILQLRQQAFVDAAKLQGHGALYIIVRHLLPNTMPSILVVLSFAIPSAIFTEAFLSFLGLGVVPPQASWGSLCNEGLANFLAAPHVLLFPALFISLAVLAFNLLGDGLRDAIDQEVQGL